MHLITVTVGKRGQITLPGAIRHQMAIQHGDRMALVQEGDRLILLPLGQTLLDRRGSVPESAPQDFSQIRQQVLQQRTRKEGGVKVYAEHERISIDPRVMAGKPCIRGTHMPVDLILEELAAGLTYEEVLDAHPHLTREDILAALAFAHDCLTQQDIILGEGGR